MAVTIANVLAGTNTFICTVIASADGDTTATCPHGMAVAPKEVNATLVLSQALAASSGWAITTIDGTNVVGTKLATAGSGSASIQLRITAKTPHSIGA